MIVCLSLMGQIGAHAQTDSLALPAKGNIPQFKRVEGKDLPKIMVHETPQAVPTGTAIADSVSIPDSVSISTDLADSTFVAEAFQSKKDIRRASRLSGRERDSLIMADLSRKYDTGWMPVPRRATILSMVFPGGGQIYNRKYWKLPIFYGGYVGCLYALTWNNQMYKDYMQAYTDIADDDPETRSYEDFLPPHFDIESNRSWLEGVLKTRKDTYRRYRDLSIFCFAGVYILSIIDAYVDAELSHFDVSDDLSLHVNPGVMDMQTASLGINLSLTF